MNVLKAKNATKLSEYIKEELNVYGYSGERVQKFIEKMYGEENVYRYSTASGKFERLSKLENDSESIIADNRQLNGETIQGRNKQNNSKRQELDNSSFSIAENIYQEEVNTINDISSIDDLIGYEENIVGVEFQFYDIFYGIKTNKIERLL